MSSWTAVTLADHEDREDIFGCAYQKADTFGILDCVGGDVRGKREEGRVEVGKRQLGKKRAKGFNE